MLFFLLEIVNQPIKVHLTDWWTHTTAKWLFYLIDWPLIVLYWLFRDEMLQYMYAKFDFY